MPRTDRPDIVLVLTDQMRYDVVGANGSRVATTPRIDAIAAAGTRFTHAFTPTGICSPARTSMFTGRYPHNHGVMNNVTGPDALATDLRPDEEPLPARLAAAGYRTAFVGKYHVAAHEAPKRHGFHDAIGAGFYWTEDDFLGWRAACGHPITETGPAFPVTHFTRYPPLTPEGARRVRQRGVPLMGRERVPFEATPPYYLVDRALGLLDDYAGSPDPFFLVLSFVGPHWPHMVPEPFWSAYDPAAMSPWPSFADDFAGKPGSHRKGPANLGVDGWTWEDWAPVVASYFASVSFHDELIGRFVDGLDARAGDDTLLVVTTDHGDMTGSHRLFNKGPWMYDDVYRIPFFARWPGPGAAGSVRDEFVSTLDLTPTLLAAAGVAVPDGLDGRDFGPLLRGEAPGPWRDSWFAEFHGDEFGLYSQRMLRTDRYKYVFNPHDVDELYDLDADPWEMANVAADPAYASPLRRLQARLWARMADSSDPLAPATGNFLA